MLSEPVPTLWGMLCILLSLLATLYYCFSVCCLILCLRCKTKDTTSYKRPQNPSRATKLEPTFGGQNLRDVCTSVTPNITNKWVWIQIPRMSAFKKQAPDKRSIFRSHHQGLTQQITAKETSFRSQEHKNKWLKGKGRPESPKDAMISVTAINM